MRHSDQFAQIATALAAAQGAFPQIPKDRTVTVKMRSGGQYTFAYAPLDTIIEKTRPPLTANGLAVMQSVVTDEKGAEYLRTMLMHTSGEWFSNDTPMFTAGGENASQGYASGMTYARRYGYSAILCIAADDDDDGTGNQDGQRGTGQQRSQEPRQQRSDRPAQPRAKQAQASAANEDAAPGINGLTDGQRRLLLAKAKNAGHFSEEELLEKFPAISTANLNDVMDQLAKIAAERDAQ